MKPDQEQGPSAPEIREALRQILASPAFVQSPQLGAFLRFVVESALAGQAEYIKSYTIAVEALGRPDSFDPKADPIVRVEAGRLRRALSRYYADGRAKHAVIIELPLGNYVPAFRRAKSTDRVTNLGVRLRGRLASPVGALAGIAAAVLIAAVGYALFAALESREPIPILASAEQTPSAPIPIVPIVVVQAFDTIGASPQQVLELDAFRTRLRDALARFDEIEVASDGSLPSAQPPTRSSYRLGGFAEYHSDGTLKLSLWLADGDEGTIVWTSVFDLDPANGPAINDVVKKVATKLAQPYGIIYARELSDDRTDPRYRCVLGALEYRRGFNPGARAASDSCLQQLIERNPTFADGLALRALVAVRQYYEGEGDTSAVLEPALVMAQRALELKPQGARPRQALMSALFARGDIAAALAEGRTAVAANPNDMLVLHSYGLLLVAAGRAEEGAPLIRQAVALSPVRPAIFEYGLFLRAYALGDDADAANQSRLFISADAPLSLIARAVTAVRGGDNEKARQAVDRLLSLHPDWRDSGRQRLGRYIPSPDLLDRMLHDLAAAGFPLQR